MRPNNRRTAHRLARSLALSHSLLLSLSLFLSLLLLLRSGPTLGGQLIVAMSPQLFSGNDKDTWTEGGEEFIARLVGTQGVRLPGVVSAMTCFSSV